MLNNHQRINNIASKAFRTFKAHFAACCWLLAAALLLSGCAVLLKPRQPTKYDNAALGDVLDDGYKDYTGVIHVHTNYSHDAHGRFEDVVRVANAQQLDYVITTEHNTLKQLRDGLQGMHGTTLILLGVELSIPGGHYLAFGVNEKIDREKLTTQQAIDEVARQGGFGFIAHPFFKKGRWTDWSASGFTGLEIYNVAHDTLDENRMRLVFWTLTASPDSFYFSLLDRPYDPLRVWDNLISRHNRVVGIGGADAHEYHLMGMKFAPYDIMFRFVRTHVLIPTLKHLSANTIYDALRSGHTYTSIELATEAKGFSFIAEDNHRMYGIMGDEVALVPGLRLTASLPAPAELTLLRNGTLFATIIGHSWQFFITEPGAYRLEASRFGKPWIYSNPIYVRAPEEAQTNDK